MKKMNVSELFPGMVAAEDVFAYDGRLILTKGTVLNDKAITKLGFCSIFGIYVEDNIPGMQQQAAVQDTSYSARVQSSPEFQTFQADFSNELGVLKYALNDLVERNKDADVPMLLKGTLTMLDHVRSGSFSVLDMLDNMRQFDDLTYAHSLNVALICNVLAGWLNLPEQDIELATLCGLLHDIGKLKIPDSIIRKPSKLTDEEYAIIKTHPQEGYNILGRLTLDSHVKNAALMHHERCDGSGYPLRLTGPAIDPFAKIVAIADVYDAMTSARIYRGPQCPFTVIDLFEQEGLQKYDVHYIMTFLQHIASTYLQSRVLLSDRRTGTVIYMNNQCLSRPLVKIENGEVIDLSKHHNLFIGAIL